MVPLRPEGKKTPLWLVALGSVPVTMARIWEVVRPQPIEFESQSTMVDEESDGELPLRLTMVVVMPMSSALVPV